ncbi:MAG: hypothetical protein ACLGGX_07695 [Bdellovibrionia bacterium]
MHELIGVMKQEHQLIENALNRLKTDSSLELLQWCFDAIENEHHFKEEECLFSKLLGKKQLAEGGPFCVLYFDNYMMNQPKEILQQAKLGWHVSELQKHFIGTNSPLEIPVSEHVATHELCRHLINNYTPEEATWQRIKFRYLEIQQMHVQKENNCLFYIAEKILSDQEKDDALAMWKEKSKLLKSW